MGSDEESKALAASIADHPEQARITTRAGSPDSTSINLNDPTTSGGRARGKLLDQSEGVVVAVRTASMLASGMDGVGKRAG